jgi:hypothetical protein
MQVSWWVELAVRPGCLDAFETLTGEMVAAAHAEGGVLAYQRFIGDDRQTVHVPAAEHVVGGIPARADRLPERPAR